MAKKVTFTLPSEVVADATAGVLLGDFNNWDESKGAKLKKEKDGSYTATLSLEPGTYSYRYLLSDGRWVNDHNQSYAPAHGLGVENCVITVEADVETPVAPAPKKKAAVKAEVAPAPTAPKTVAKKAAAKAEPTPAPAPAPAAKKAAPVKAAKPAPAPKETTPAPAKAAVKKAPAKAKK